MILYRHPGPLIHPTRGFSYDQRDFDGPQDGWFDTLEEAAGLVPPKEVKAPEKEVEKEPAPTRDEMIQQAEKIGLKVDKRWSDARLLTELNKG
jgi:hypothetical protein